MIQIGDVFPNVTLYEFNDVPTDACPIGPLAINTREAFFNKKIVLTGAPGAFTPACSDLQIPGYIDSFDRFKQMGVDDIYCVAVNDAFVMGAWAKAINSQSKVRMIADGSGLLTKALGLELDLSLKGFGVRCQRFSMLIDKGVVKLLNVDVGVSFDRSTSDVLLAQMSIKNNKS